MAPRKWYTCTPVRFSGDHTFFARDSGLLCKGFQEIGIDCKAIMPGPAMETDQVEDMIRTDYHNLEDPAWWKSLGGEGVVFYGWGEGRYWKIARAIRKSGLLFVSHIDASGVISILNGFTLYAGIYWRVSIASTKTFLGGLWIFLTRLGYATTVALLQNDFRRALHLRKAHLIGAVTPIALERLRKVFQIYGGDPLVSRLHLLPHAVAPYMSFDPAISKERLVVAVGRWNEAHVKGTDCLMQITESVLSQDKFVRFEIYGLQTDGLRRWHENLPEALRERIHLGGTVPNRMIKCALQRARIELCTSLRESYHIISAEALCCGCSVVGPASLETPSMPWFTNDSGRMTARNADEMAGAVLAELADWDDGRRDPAAISAYWSRILHAPRVAERILELVATPITTKSL